MRRDYVTTFLTEGAVIASYLLVFRLVAQHLGSTGFGEYAVARRTLSFLSPLAVLGLDVAIARYVAYAIGRRRDYGAYVPAALILMAVAITVLGAVMLIFQRSLAAFFFGSDNFSELIPPLVVLLIGADVQVIAYGYLRGRILVRRANLLMGINQALVPLAAVVAGGDSVPRILYLIGAGWFVFGAVALMAHRKTVRGVWGRVKELSAFGVQRVPGDIFQFALFSGPAVVVAHEADIRVAGLTAFGIAALGMVGSVLSPISFILLPTASRGFADGSVEEVRRHSVAIARGVMVMLIVGVVTTEVFAEPLVVAYLGPRFAEGANILRMLVTAAFPWGFYISMKSLIDAHHERAVNALNMAIAFAIFCLLTGIAWLMSRAPLGVILAFVISLYVLAALTLMEVRKVISTPINTAEREPAVEDQPVPVGREAVNDA